MRSLAQAADKKLAGVADGKAPADAQHASPVSSFVLSVCLSAGLRQEDNDPQRKLLIAETENKILARRYNALNEEVSLLSFC